MGIDLSLFKGRIVLEADAYIKNSRDLLYSYANSYYSGFGTLSINFGEIDNRGLEFMLRTTNIRKKNFSWTTTFNISMNRNKIVELAGGEDYFSGDFSIGREGLPIGMFYAHKFLGVYARDEDNFYRYDQFDQPIQIRRGSNNGEIFKGGDVI